MDRLKIIIFVSLLLNCLVPKVQGAELLSEAEVIRQVLERNLRIRSSTLEPKLGETGVQEAISQYDTQIEGEASYRLDRSDKTSQVFGTDNRTILYEAKASRRLPFGVDSSVRFSNRRESTNSAFSTLPSFYDTRLVFDLRAPMLRNRFGKTDRGNVEIARAQKQAGTKSAFNNIEAETFRAVEAYWNWVASFYYIELSESFLKRAKDFLSVTQQKRILGTSEDPDVLAAEALVTIREIELMRAKNLNQDFEKELITLLDYRNDQKIKTKEKLTPVKRPPSKNEMIKTALAYRNDYRGLIDQAKAKEIQIAVAKDQKYPALDLFTTLDINSVDSSYTQALSETWSGQNPDWRVGAQFSLSFENRRAKSILQRNQLEKVRVLLQIKDLENRIALEIDLGLREYLLQKKEVVQLGRAANLQKKRLDIELRNYGFGRSSSDIIVRFQEDYLEAERRRLEAELRLKLAWVDLRRSMSTLIPTNVEIIPGEAR